MTTIDTAARVLRRDRRARRTIITPEGVPLSVELAQLGERATAFAIDLFIWFLASLLVLFTLMVLVTHGLSMYVGFAILLFVMFVVRNFYFIHFELSWQGTTPGKRIVGIRVIDRNGGPLVPAAVIARNLTREIEVFIPLGVLLSTQASATVVPWERLALAAWMIGFLALVFVNRDRMRAGDLIAGTLVIALPRQKLSGDLVQTRLSFAFTDRQLKAYGAYELQVLEQLLRRPDATTTAPVLREVCDKICRKIAWEGAVSESETARFLTDFYTAQRAFLEREQLFGRPRADKHHLDGKPPA